MPVFFGMGRDKMGWFARGQASSEGRGMVPVGATREREEEKKEKRPGNCDTDWLDVLRNVLVLSDTVAEIPATVANIH